MESRTATDVLSSASTSGGNQPLAGNPRKGSILTPERFRFLVVLALAVGIRLINIQSPLLEFHSWRQTTTAMMARNLSLNGYNILYPQVDYFGPTAVSLESEFPLYPFIVSLFYGAFGVQEWLARLVAVLFSVGSTWLLYALVKRYFGAGPAFFAGVFFSLSPFSIFFGRAVMPEPAMLFLSIAAIWAFSRWTDTGKKSYYLLSMLVAVLASMVKLPSLYIALPISFLFLSSASTRGKGVLKSLYDWRIWLWGSVATLTPFLWYVHAAAIGVETGASLGLLSSGGGDRLGTIDMWLSPDFYRVFFTWFISDISTWGAFPFFLLGIIWLPRRRDELVMYVWLLAIIIYVFAVANGMVSQEYYILPVAPVMAVFAGKGASRLLGLAVYRFKLLLVLAVPAIILSVGATGVYSYQRLVPLYRTTDAFMDAARMTAEVTQTGTPVIAVHYGEPEILYYSDRKGWHLFPDQFTPEKVDELKAKGARALVLTEQAGLAGKQKTVDVLKGNPVIGVADSSILVSLGADGVPGADYIPLAASFGNIIDLQGIKVDRKVVSGGDRLAIGLRLKARDKINDDLRISLRLIASSNYSAGQLDSVPANGYMPTNTWDKGQVLDDLYLLPVLEGSLPGQYSLELRIYRNHDLLQLPIDGGSTTSLALGSISVLPSFKATVPSQWTTVDRQFDSDLRLIGVNLRTGIYRPGDYVRVSSLWQAKRADLQGYEMFYKLTSTDGQVSYEDRLELSSGFRPDQWESGQVVRLEHNVRVPAKIGSGAFILSLGLLRDTQSVLYNSGSWPFEQRASQLDIGKISVESRERATKIPESIDPVDIILGETLRLEGYRFSSAAHETWQPGEKIPLTLVWQALAEIETSYAVFVHLLGEGGQVLSQTDSIPQGGAAPTSGWAEGEEIADPYVIIVPADLAPGSYLVEVGIYDPQSGERLRTLQGDDRVLLAPVEVVAR